MTASAFAGPLIAFGQNPTVPEYNPDIGPSMFWGGAALLDPRPPFIYTPGSDGTAITAGFLGSSAMMTLNLIPRTIAAAAIAAAANTVSGTAMTLVSSNSAANGISVSQSIVNSSTGATVTGLVAIGNIASATGTISGTTFTVASALTGQFYVGMTLSGTGVTSGTKITGQLKTSSTVPTFTVDISQTVTSTTITGIGQGISSSMIPFGSNQGIRLWNPQALMAQAVKITCNNALGTGGNIVVAGYDMYGYPMSESIAIVPGSAVTAIGKKAFKYIASATPDFTDATYTYSLGTSDTYGLPLRSDFFGDLLINDVDAVITASTGYVAADTTQTATTTTGDVRGTYVVQTASNNSRRLVVWQTPMPANVGSISGLFGVTQA